MVGKLIQVGWKDTWFKAGWLVTLGAERSFLFYKYSLGRVPRDLRNAKLAKRFEKLVSGTDFVRWWDQTSGQSGDTAFVLRFPDGAWDIPWELLIDLQSSQANVSVARSPEQISAWNPSVFDEALRILLIQGDDGASVGQKLDLSLEAEQLRASWEALENRVKQCVEQPVIQSATSANLTSLVSQHKPHVVWFSGHGTNKPTSRLLLADKKWVDAPTLAGLISASGHKPLFAVFWACDTGRPDASAVTALSPALFRELRNIGILSVLAMQSPIRDVSARSMARDLLGYLAVGMPLERAVGRARSSLLTDRPTGAHPFDWATPVVWSSGEPLDHLNWNSPAQPSAQFQLLGRQSLRLQSTRPSQLNGSPSANERAAANTWSAVPKIWVSGDPGSAEHQFRWVRTLQAIQTETNWFVLAVEMQDADTETALKQWAEGIYRRILPEDVPEGIARLLNEFSTATVARWRELCALPNIFLAISNPPKFPTPDWFWNPLVSGAAPRVAVLSAEPISNEIQTTWNLDRLSETGDRESIAEELNRAERLARAMAVLNMPIGASYIEVGPAGKGSQSFQQWPGSQSVTITTPAGPVLTASARKIALGSMDAESVKLAHKDCVEILGNPQLLLTTQIREQRLEHLLQSGFEAEALEEADILCNRYREEDRPFPVLNVIRRLGSLQTQLPSRSRLVAAWAYLQLGQIKQSKYWLARSTPSLPLDIAWKHGLLAEIFKSEGTEYSKETALSEIDQAIQACRTVLTNASVSPILAEKRLRAYRQDRARILQYLFHNLEAAAGEYEMLVTEWSDQPDAAIDLAVVKRNYAECLRRLATGPGDPRSQRARDLIAEALQLVENNPRAPVLSEIPYERAKQSEADGNIPESRNFLEACKKAAMASHHFMMYAIAKNRLFWKFEQFSLAGWKEIDGELETFPNHGWAVRTLIEGRLRTAQYLQSQGGLREAAGVLQSTLSILQRNPAFDKGSDRFRIAATYAGLQSICELLDGKSTSWSDFLSRYPWSDEWLATAGMRDAAHVWSEVR